MISFKKILKEENKVSIGYNFPLSYGSGKQGINDAGVETFKGTPNKHLAKEIIQNSLDAKDIHCKEAVKVEFKLSEISINTIPYVADLKEIFEKCKNFWGQENDRKSLDFINKGINILEKEYIRVLEVADYNTIGLKGARKSKDNIFAKLVTDSGVSNKKEGSGGSFGIGKNAPYTCSDLRTVLYSTLDEEGVQALQGVSRLLSHRNKEGLLTQGRGFLGIEEKNNQGDIVNQPFVNNNEIKDLDKYIKNEEFIRKEQGTSIYILGYSNYENWEDEIIIAILEHYMISIIDGELEVVVGKHEINKKTIEMCIYQFKDKFKESNILQYYKAYKQKGDNVKIKKEDFNDMGEIELYLLLDDEICNKKVAYVRNNGMKIIDKDRFRVLTKFNGVLVFRGDEINEFIRSLENPSHDKIEPERYEKPKIARSLLKELAEWIKNSVNELSDTGSDELIEMEGLGRYLPAEIEEKVNAEFKESIKKKIKDRKIKKVSKIKKAKKMKTIEDGEDITVEQTSPTSEKTAGTDNENAGQASEESNGLEQNNSSGVEKKLRAIEIEKSRVMMRAREGYRIMIKSSNKGCVYVGINLIGEVGAESAKILEAKDNETGKSYEIRKNQFGPVEFEKGEIKKFDIKIKGKSVYSMEVETSANSR